MKKHSERFENAVTKLYNAFHSGELNANDCAACACGNICDNNYKWSYASLGLCKGNVGIGVLNRSVFIDNEAINVINKTGYSAKEIITIEKAFLNGMGYQEYTAVRKGTNEQQFQGLCAVIEYLCELEGIPNIMDYQKLFEAEHEPLESVFA